jgi:glycerol-1-phosphate dehydrogenase [NAD(P)+]
MEKGSRKSAVMNMPSAEEITNIHTYIGTNAIDVFLDFAASHNYRHLLIVADDNTYDALGNQVEAALQEQKFNPHNLILQGYGVHVKADARSILNVLVAIHPETEVIVAVGAGTITDIVRFVSHSTGLPFVSIPTAASVDAYSSNTASIMVEGVKHSYQAKQPEAIFVSVDTLRDAPLQMTASGFGDMLAKYTALADWKLAHLLVDEPYDGELAKAIGDALDRCVAEVKGINEHSRKGIRVLIDGLIVSGNCIAKAKKSRPASGSEHSLSHYWEITHPNSDERLALHGTRTGMATGIIAALYEKIGCLSREEVATRLENANFPNPYTEKVGLQQVFGEIGKEIANNRYSFLGISNTDYQHLKHKILARWDGIIEIASDIPSRDEITSLLLQVNGISSPQEIGISREEVEQALRWAAYIRPRFTVLELYHMLASNEPEK